MGGPSHCPSAQSQPAAATTSCLSLQLQKPQCPLHCSFHQPQPYPHDSLRHGSHSSPLTPASLGSAMVPWPPAPPAPPPPHASLHTWSWSWPPSGPVPSESVFDILYHPWACRPPYSLPFIPEAPCRPGGDSGLIESRASESGRPAQILALPILCDLGNDLTNPWLSVPSQCSAEDKDFLCGLKETELMKPDPALCRASRGCQEPRPRLPAHPPRGSPELLLPPHSSSSGGSLSFLLV